MQTIGVFHTKGGVGKSAVSVFLTDFLSSLHEARVLLVDLDPQKALDWGNEEDVSIPIGYHGPESAGGTVR